jgi:glycosyltransferase involved in cell wall biosynthesis
VSAAEAPQVSVLVPSLNSGEFLGTAVASALSAGPKIEVIVQDGGSRDNTRQLLDGFGDPRIRLISERDRGQADALNRALAAARGEYVLWLNADDVIVPAGVQEALETDLTADVIYGSSGLIDACGNRIKAYHPAPLSYTRLLRRGTYIFSGSLLIRREVLQSIGGFSPDLECCMDFELLLRLARSEPSVMRIESEIGLLRVHAASKSEREPWRFFWEHWHVAWRERSNAPHLVPAILLAQLQMAVYLLSRRLWRSRTWLALRPAKKR